MLLHHGMVCLFSPFESTHSLLSLHCQHHDNPLHWKWLLQLLLCRFIVMIPLFALAHCHDNIPHIFVPMAGLAVSSLHDLCVQITMAITSCVMLHLVLVSHHLVICPFHWFWSFLFLTKLSSSWMLESMLLTKCTQKRMHG